MKNKKVIIFVILISVYALISLVIANTILGDNNGNSSGSSGNSSGGNSNPGTSEIEKKDYKYLLVEDTDIWVYDNNKWNSKKKIDEEKEKFTILINNQYFGDYYIKKANKWNIFDENDKFVNYNGNFLAHTEDFNVNVKDYIMGSVAIEDLSEIINLLGYNTSISSLTTNEKLVLDLDSNGINDKIVNISNLDSELEEVYFNLIYVVMNGQTDVLVKQIIDIDKLLEEPIYNIQYVLNINREEYDSIIFQKRYFSNAGETNSVLYHFVDNKYEIAVD